MKKNIFNIIVPLEFDGFRIDKLIQLQIKNSSRTKIQSLIYDNQVKLNDKIINKNSKKVKKK